MATYSAKCSKCGTKFSSTSDLAGLTGRGTCPDCKRDENRAKSMANLSDRNTSKPSQPIIIKKGPSADEIIAEAQAGQLKYELSMKKKEDSASKPWMFDANFSSESSISKITFPDNADDIEKTILRITKTAIDKIKRVIDLSHAEFQQQTLGDQKALWKPLYEEINFTDACIEKASEGIKKLRRFEGKSITEMMEDCQDSLDELKNKWYVKLIEKRNKKKKQTLILMFVVIILFIAMMIGLSLAS
jgi:hypothetical protein